MTEVTRSGVERVVAKRPTVDVMDGADRHEIKVHDHGLVALVDVMPRLSPNGTADFAVVQAARVSYGDGTKQVNEDRGLIRYLMRHRHTTPLEMVEFKFHQVMPIFVARQWIRHRTACLTGDTLLHFDLPSGIDRRGNQLYTLSVEEVYERFQPTEAIARPDKQRNKHYRRYRVQSMNLRRLNEETEAIEHTQIVDIWETGEKDVWEVRYEGRNVKASADHLFLTDNGWRRLGDVADLNTEGPSAMRGGHRLSWIGPAKGTGVVPTPNTIDVESEQWTSAPNEWRDYYEVSDQGRVRRVAGGKGSARGRCKTQTVSQGRAVVSLNRPGVQETWLVHQLVMRAFVGDCPEGQEVCHEDGNSLNNDLDNLRYGSKQSNANDRVRDGATTGLARIFVTPKIRYVGKRMTYDIEVAGPWHNFSADGFVVHNSVNEYSARYSVVKERFYVPGKEEVRAQSKVNKQGSEGQIDLLDAETFAVRLENHCEASYSEYERALNAGVGREQARMFLPLNVYTEWYWKIDLHNLFHFLSLRMDPHAQKEIRDYANAMFDLIQPIVPLCCEAFVDYRLQGMTLSRLEVEAILGKRPHLDSDNKREQEEWAAKKARLGL